MGQREKEILEELKARKLTDHLHPDELATLERRASETPVSKVESVARGASQGLTAGFQPRLSALAEKTIASVSNLIGIGDQDTAKRVIAAPFSELAASQKQDVTASKAENPKAFFAGDVVGAGLLSALPIGIAGKASKGTGLLARGAQGFLKGAQTAKGAAAIAGTEAAARTLGEEDEITSESFGKAALAGGVGAAVGGLSQAIANKISARLANKATKEVSEEIKRATTRETTTELIGPATEEATKTTRIRKFAQPRDIPTPSNEESLLAKISKKKPEDISYFSKHKKAVMENVENLSLDERAPNTLSGAVVEDFALLEARLKAREAAAGEMIEKSEALFDTNELKFMWLESIDRVKKSGESATGAGKEAISKLQEAMDLVPDGDVWDAKTMRQYVQGLWKTNKAALIKRGSVTAELTPAEKAVDEVVNKNLNVYLKNQVGKKYGDLMDVYAKEVRVKKAFENLTNVNNWFKNRMVKPVADVVDGTVTSRSISDKAAAKNWVKIIQDFGDEVGRDYQKIIKDNLVYGRLFPEKAGGGQMGPLTNQIGGIVGSLAKGRPGAAAAGAARAAGQSADDAGKFLLEEILIKERKITTNLLKKIVKSKESSREFINRVSKTTREASRVGNKTTGGLFEVAGRTIPATGAINDILGDQ